MAREMAIGLQEAAAVLLVGELAQAAHLVRLVDRPDLAPTGGDCGRYGEIAGDVRLVDRRIWHPRNISRFGWWRASPPPPPAAPSSPSLPPPPPIQPPPCGCSGGGGFWGAPPPIAADMATGSQPPIAGRDEGWYG